MESTDKPPRSRAASRRAESAALTPVDVRAKALQLLEAGRLTPAQLVKLAQQRVEVLYDVMEMNYGDDDVTAVDTLRSVSVEAAQLILNKAKRGKA